MSSSNLRVKELLAANAVFAESYTAPYTMEQLREGIKDPVIVLTCMDPRVVPEEFVGPRPMLAVFRNAGGRCSPDVVRTITVLRSLASKGNSAAVMVVHHTDCGMTHLTDEGIRADVLNRDPRVDDVPTDFGCFAAEDLEKTILEDVESLKAEKLLEGLDIKGYVLTTETGLLREL